MATEFKIPEHFEKRVELLTRLRGEYEALEGKLRDINDNISQLGRVLAHDLKLDVVGGVGVSKGKRPGRRSSSATQADLTIIKDSVLKTLRDAKEWVNTMALSERILDVVPGANAALIGRAKKELSTARDIKVRGQKRGAEYHA